MTLSKFKILLASVALAASGAASSQQTLLNVSYDVAREFYKDINAVVSGAKKMGDVDAASWPQHLKDQAASVETWPNITEQKKALPGADDAAKEENKIAALTLEPGP